MTRIRYDTLQQSYRLIRDCLEGEQAIKDAGQLYVPPPSALTGQEYSAYIKRGCFYDAPAMTLRALTGLALRKDPVVKLPARLEPMRLNATDENAPLSILIEEATREVLSMGRFGIFLDFPREGNSANSVPYMATFKAENIEDYQTAYVDGRKELVRVILATDDTWEDAQVFLELVIEDTLYKIRRFVKEGPKEERVDIEDEIIPTVNGTALNAIPFLMVSNEGIRPDDVRPPFEGLCHVSISHFRNSCDRERAIFLTSSPTPWIAANLSADKVPQSIGSGALWVLPEGATVGMLEYEGHGVASQKALMDEKVETMAQLGARMISATVNRNEDISTATQRTRSELSLLHGTVVSVEAAVSQMLRLAANWMGSNPDEVSVTLSRDFIETMIEPRAIEALLKAVNAGMLSRATFYENPNDCLSGSSVVLRIRGRKNCSLFSQGKPQWRSARVA